MTLPEDAVLLAGATGYIGRAVARELVDRGHRVVAVVRRMPDPADAAALDGCELIVSDVTDQRQLTSALAAVRADTVISCIASRTGEPADAWRVDYEANQNLLGVATDAINARRFILLSAICVQKPVLAFQHAKLAFESELQTSGLDFSIVRPTAFFKSLSGQVERVRAGKPFIVFGKGTETACKPISERDLAHYIVDCISNAERKNRILPIGGPGDAITPCEQGKLLFELLGREPRFRHVSPGIFRAANAVLAPFARWSEKAAAKAELARIGRYYATESMLFWDADHERYDAAQTPSTGTDSLRDHYARMLDGTGTDQDLGDHKLF